MFQVFFSSKHSENPPKNTFRRSHSLVENVLSLVVLPGWQVPYKGRIFLKFSWVFSHFCLFEDRLRFQNSSEPSRDLTLLVAILPKVTLNNTDRITSFQCNVSCLKWLEYRTCACTGRSLTSQFLMTGFDTVQHKYRWHWPLLSVANVGSVGGRGRILDRHSTCHQETIGHGSGTIR